MKLFNLGLIDWLDSQLIYHSEPRVGLECLNILAPKQPYVCIGLHQDAEQEVDLSACRERKLPVFRREVGGGAVYLDGRQIFFHLVLHRENPLAAGDKLSFYKRLLAPVVETYKDLGVPARFKPVNDIVTEKGQKISGTGVAEIEDYIILVGNLIADFDYETMVKILKVPDEKYRDKIYSSLRENLTTLKRETGRDFSIDELAGPLISRFSEVLGPLEPAELPGKVVAKKEELKPAFLSEEWIYRKGKRNRAERELKISGDVQVVQRVHKAPGGLLRGLLVIRDGVYEQVTFSGDFFCYPGDAVNRLEVMLTGKAREQAASVIAEFYNIKSGDRAVETPGVGPEDWLAVLNPPSRGKHDMK